MSLTQPLQGPKTVASDQMRIGQTFDRAIRFLICVKASNIASRRVAEKNGMTLIKEIEWRDKPTCVYAIERSNSAA